LTAGDASSLAVSIVAWNCIDELTECLEALQRELPECEVHVIDNASTDGTVAVVRQRFPSVHLVEAGKNLGFAPGHNRLLGTIRADYGLILNPDTIVNREAVLRCIRFADADATVGVVSCGVRDETGELQPGNFRKLPTLWTRFTEEFFLNRLTGHGRRGHFGESGPAVEVEVVPGAFVILRMSLGRAIGFFDGNLFLYSEDTDLCLRVRQAGYRVYYLRDVSITHHGARSTVKSFRSSAYEFYRSEDYYFQKHRPAGVVIAYRLIVVGGTALRLAIWSAARLVRAGSAPARCAVYGRVLRSYARAAANGSFFRRTEVLASARPA